MAPGNEGLVVVAVSRCPDRKELQQLLLGRTSEEAAERLEQHVAQCGPCSRLLPTLPANDTLVETMRAGPTLSLQPSDRKVIQHLITRLHGLRATVPPPHSRTTGVPTQGEAGLASANSGSFAFLSPPQAPGEIGRLGPYRVLSLLGQGGMGVVFLAEDPHLQRPVALKVMRPDIARKASARERFLREARAMAKIGHDHIVTIFHVGEDRGVPFLAMQLLEGMSLEEFLRKHASLTVEQILKLGREIARGLAAAHDKGLIHRDIKPANIWLDATAGGRVKILDFGLARAAEEDLALTRLGTIIGTPGYMAPEQAGSDRIDGRADLFSLGCVLYRLCTGRLPWKGGDAIDTLTAVATTMPIPVEKLNPNLPPRMARLVMHLLAKKPADRPESAGGVAQALQALERELSALQKTPTPPVAVRVPALPASVRQDSPTATARIVQPPARRRPLRSLAVCAATAALLLAAGVLYFRSDKGTPAKDGQDSQPSAPVKYLTNSIGMKLAPIPAGEFLMGFSAADRVYFKQDRAGSNLTEKAHLPQHRVRISKAFYLGACEVTQAQYEKVMGTNPSANKESPDHPVDTVVWDDAMQFCRMLSALPAEKQAGHVYRLPTEAEWEYACRAGTTTATHYGNSLSSQQANFDGASPLGAAAKGPRIGRTVRVGSYAPNAWGLYDMHGNVWEWCLDGPREYTDNPVTDPRGPETAGADRVLRGGSWREGAVIAALRKPRDPVKYRGNYVGFRVLLVGPPAARDRS